MRPLQSAVVVSAPGPIRAGLRALLQVVSDVQVVEADESILTQPVRNVVSPRLVLVNPESTGDSLYASLQQVRRAFPNAYCIVLARDCIDPVEVQMAGADDVVLQGINAGQLAVRLQQVLS